VPLAKYLKKRELSCRIDRENRGPLHTLWLSQRNLESGPLPSGWRVSVERYPSTPGGAVANRHSCKAAYGVAVFPEQTDGFAHGLEPRSKSAVRNEITDNL
jgi:hypothetical protein